VPRLSVLLPVKDGATTIRSAVRSTLRAMPRDAELLVVDDGSSDATGVILDRIEDPRLKVIRHEGAQGVAASLNHALEVTDSELVGRMDADDITLPWRFRVQLPALDTADLVFGSMILIDERSRPVGLGSPWPVSPASAALHLLFENPFAHPTMVGRRAALTAPGGYRGSKVEDYDLWLRAVHHGARLRKLSAPVLAYRRHAGQATQSWVTGAPDPILDESFSTALPERLQPFTTPLRAAAVARQHQGDLAEGWSELSLYIEQRSSTLAPRDRRQLLRRLHAAG
jgi:hypothetical protein